MTVQKKCCVNIYPVLHTKQFFFVSSTHTMNISIRSVKFTVLLLPSVRLASFTRQKLFASEELVP